MKKEQKLKNQKKLDLGFNSNFHYCLSCGSSNVKYLQTHFSSHGNVLQFFYFCYDCKYIFKLVSYYMPEVGNDYP